MLCFGRRCRDIIGSFTSTNGPVGAPADSPVFLVDGLHLEEPVFQPTLRCGLTVKTCENSSVLLKKRRLNTVSHVPPPIRRDPLPIHLRLPIPHKDPHETTTLKGPGPSVARTSKTAPTTILRKYVLTHSLTPSLPRSLPRSLTHSLTHLQTQKEVPGLNPLGTL